jgi:hypothetical protein
VFRRKEVLKFSFQGLRVQTLICRRTLILAILAEEALLLSYADSRALIPRFSMIFNRLILATGAAGPLLHLHTMSTGVHLPQIQCCAI